MTPSALSDFVVFDYLFLTSTVQWIYLGDVQATSLGWKFCSYYLPSDVSPLPCVISALTGPSNIFLLFIRSLATSSFPSTTTPPTRISSGRNLFYPIPLQVDCLQFSQWSQQKKRRSHSWALKSAAYLLAGGSRPYCSFSHTHCHFPFLTYVPCCQNKLNNYWFIYPHSGTAQTAQSHSHQQGER